MAAGLLVGFMVLAAAGPVTFTTDMVEVETDAGRHRFRVEMATTADQRARGLMNRKSLAADAGMLFDFGRSRSISMWMKDTLIPLDMLFADRRGRIVHVHRDATPGSTDLITAGQPVRAVLELPGGTAGRLGIAAGHRLRHTLFGQDKSPP